MDSTIVESMNVRSCTHPCVTHYRGLHGVYNLIEVISS